MPSSDLIALAQNYLTQEDIKAETDLITVLPAEEVEYTVSMTYKVSQRDSEQATAIQTAVEQAVDDYIKSIHTSFGNAINPEMLQKAAYAAGAASVTVTSPSYTALASYEVAKCTSKTVTYAGLLT